MKALFDQVDLGEFVVCDLDLPRPLGTAARYRHFVKRAADWEEVWSLYEDGWLMMHDDDGRLLLPLWPARRYAEAHRLPSWGAKAEALPIALDELLQEWLPGLSKEDRGISVFPVIGADGSIHPSLDGSGSPPEQRNC